MFRAVISRDNGCPWGETGMTSAKWLHVPTQTVAIAHLTATQPGVLLHALIGENTPVGGDTMPHVIAYDNELYLEDGHHRVTRALLNGQTTIEARVLEVTPEGRGVGISTTSAR